jgi:hypothetical protein
MLKYSGTCSSSFARVDDGADNDIENEITLYYEYVGQSTAEDGCSTLFLSALLIPEGYLHPE